MRRIGYRLGSLTDANSIAIVGKDLLNSKVTDDDIGRLLHEPGSNSVSMFNQSWIANLHSEARQDSVRIFANNAGVAANASLVGGLADFTANKDDLCVITRDSLSEGRIGRDGRGCTTRATSSASILASISSCGLDVALFVSTIESL